MWNMTIVSTTDFRANQSKYFDRVNAGEHIVVKSRTKGSFRIVPVMENDDNLSEKDLRSIKQGLDEVTKGETYRLHEKESFDEFLNRVGQYV